MYYKLIKEQEIIGAISQADFRKYQQKHGRILFADEETGQFVEYNAQYYYDNWLRPLPEGCNITCTKVEIVRIEEDEYASLAEALEIYETIEVEEPEIPEEEIIIDPETPNETLEFVREAKIAQMSNECNRIIQNGFDITLSDGVTHHFSLKEEDQQNLNTLAIMMMSGENMLPYHADGEPCIFLSQQDAQSIFSEAIKYKTYVVTKFNSLKIYINALSDIEAIRSITFDTEIPEEYQSMVWKYLLSQGQNNEMG